MSKKAVVAMSGGLDSSIVAYLLQKEGFEVIGVTALMQGNDKDLEIANNAKAVCDKLGIEHYSIDVVEEFQEAVVEYFENSYINGYTPNPCIMCNKQIKWGAFYKKCEELFGFDYFATGHYANIEEKDGHFIVSKAKDEKKDQLYYLFELSSEELSKTIFPLYKYEKDEIRQIAIENDLPCKSAKESQDVCFIPDDTKKYLKRKFPSKKGDFVEINTNKILGEHDGFYQYTIGQRKGIGIAYPYPLYVIKLDAKKNIVYVGKKEDLFQDELILKNINWHVKPQEQKFNAKIKVRYNTSAKNCKVNILDDNRARVEFAESEKSITPGQAGVFYSIDENYLLGGGWI